MNKRVSMHIAILTVVLLGSCATREAIDEEPLNGGTSAERTVRTMEAGEPPERPIGPGIAPPISVRVELTLPDPPLPTVGLPVALGEADEIGAIRLPEPNLHTPERSTDRIGEARSTTGPSTREPFPPSRTGGERSVAPAPIAPLDDASAYSDGDMGPVEHTSSTPTEPIVVPDDPGDRSLAATPSRPVTPRPATPSRDGGGERVTAPSAIEAPDPVRERVELRSVEAGTTFEIRLPGPMWVYLGSDGTVDFLRRTTEGDTSVFTFRFPRGIGEERPVLRFEAQDLATGRVERRLISLDVGDDGRPLPIGDDGTITGVSEEGATVSGQSSVIDEDPPTLTERITHALEGREPINETDPTLVHDLVSVLENEENPRLDGDRYLSLSERLVDEGAGEDARALIRRLVDLEYSPYDRLLFALARLYEEAGPGRDLQRARTLYEELVRDYPLSVHWRESRGRIEYLDRHFFLIR